MEKKKQRNQQWPPISRVLYSEFAFALKKKRLNIKIEKWMGDSMPNQKSSSIERIDVSCSLCKCSNHLREYTWAEWFMSVLSIFFVHSRYLYLNFLPVHSFNSLPFNMFHFNWSFWNVLHQSTENIKQNEKKGWKEKECEINFAMSKICDFGMRSLSSNKEWINIFKQKSWEIVLFFFGLFFLCFVW